MWLQRANHTVIQTRGRDEPFLVETREATLSQETLNFTFTDATTGQPVSVNIVVTLNDTPNSDGSYTVTDATGTYGNLQITGVAPVNSDGSDNELFLNGGPIVDLGGITFTTNGAPDGATDDGAWSANQTADPSEVNLFYTGTDGRFSDQDAYAIDTSTTSFVSDISVCCFCAGTRIRTPDGEAPVESLRRGDLVVTVDGVSRPIIWLGVQTVSTVFADPLRVTPIRIRAGALGENAPAHDLRLSPDHALLVEDVLIQAGALVNGTSIVREPRVPRQLVYYHVELDDHSLILAENTPAETFIDNVDRLAFDNWAEHEALHPDGKPIEELSYPRAKSHRQVPRRIRAALQARAVAIGAVEAAA